MTTTDINTQVLTNLKLFGYHVIPNFISQAECERLRKHIDDIMDKHAHKVQRDFKEGMGGDHRLFGLENTNKTIYDSLYNLPFFQTLKTYTQERNLTPCTVMTNWISSADKSDQTHMINSGGSWHRDPGTQYGTKVKTIIYLSDVSKKNGPFTIIPNSRVSDVGVGHTREDCAYFHKGLRIYDDFVEDLRIQYSKIPVEVTGSAGTMIVVDVGNIHRGKPIQKGTRYSLTNYFDSNLHRSNMFKQNNKHFVDH